MSGRTCRAFHYNILNISFLRVGIEPTSCRIGSRMLSPCNTVLLFSIPILLPGYVRFTKILYTHTITG